MFRSLLLPQYINRGVDGVLASLTGVPQISGCAGDPHPVKDGPTTDAKAERPAVSELFRASARTRSGFSCVSLSCDTERLLWAP